MSWNSKVVWSEGMFLRPQHFQQHTRYVERLVESRCGHLRSYPWGFTQLEVDEQSLGLGKLSIRSAQGVFPDGTPFAIPEQDDPPPALDIPEDLRNARVYLSLPLNRTGTIEVVDAEGGDGVARYWAGEDEVRDTNAGIESIAQLRVGKLRMRLLLESERRDEYACLGVARVVENRANDRLVLDEAYLPPVLDCRALPRLQGMLRELEGLLHHRGDALAGRVSASGRGGAAEIADFLMLQAVNRYEPFVSHLQNVAVLHPEDFYRQAVQIAGELATFARETRRPEVLPPYRHDDLEGSFEPLMAALRQVLSMVLEQNAIPLPLEERRYGIRVSAITDRSLLDQASFVLAVSASIPAEEVRKRFPRQITIGGVEYIRQLVNNHLRGIAVNPLPVAPRQIPYNAGYVYFELERAGEYWKQLQKSGGFAIHVGGEFPSLEMEFWAIKR